MKFIFQFLSILILKFCQVELILLYMITVSSTCKNFSHIKNQLVL